MDIKQTRARIDVEVQGAEPTQDDYLTAPVMPESVIFTYFGEGTVWAEVAGYKIKKNGQPGQVWATAVFRGTTGAMPVWLRELAEQVRPAAFPKAVDTSQS